MKYKLINKQTGEEHLCDKVTIEDFDYYVSDGEININDWMFSKNADIEQCISIESYGYEGSKGTAFRKDFVQKIIASNNPNIDIPKVVDEAVKLAEKFVVDKLKKSLQAAGVLIGFIEGYNKSQETHSNSDEDMIEFARWLDDNMQQREYYPMSSMNYKELLQLWKEQRPKIVYYDQVL